MTRLEIHPAYAVVGALAIALALSCSDRLETQAVAVPARAQADPSPVPAPARVALASVLPGLPTAPLAKWLGEARTGSLLLRRLGAAPDAELSPGLALETDVELSVTGVLARAVVRQRFRNPSDSWVEGVYVFPLPDDAAVDHMRIESDGRIIEGQVQERERAKKTYERAKSEGRRASLLEQERPNVFTTSVANIAPRSEVSVEIEYQQTIELDSGTFSVRVPSVVGPRYIPGKEELAAPPQRLHGAVISGWAADTDRVPDATRITPPVALDASNPLNPLRIAVDLAPGFEIEGLASPYHEVQISPKGAGYRVELAEHAFADRDFVLQWKPKAGGSPQAFVFSERYRGDTYALLMVTPPAAKPDDRGSQPRELVYVVDTSGSMAGTSIVQARAALSFGLRTLRGGDRFNVIAFNDRSHAFFPAPVLASPDNVQRALEAVARLDANGGTEIGGAIELALEHVESAGEQPSALRQVVFLTDGSVGNEAELFEKLKEKVGETRVFTIGIGSAPNTYFMRKLAQLGRGSFTHIGDPGEVSEKMRALFGKLESVVLADLEIEVPRGVHAEMHPRETPDLYAGEPLVVAMKLDGPLDWATVRGRAAERYWRVDLRPGLSEDRPGLHVLWARRKIADLMDDRLGVRDEGALEALRKAVIEVALEHHLVSAYTSLVAVDVTPVRPANEDLASQAMASNLPAGWKAGAVFGLAQGATPATLHLLLGVLSLAASFALRGLVGRSA